MEGGGLTFKMYLMLDICIGFPTFVDIYQC